MSISTGKQSLTKTKNLCYEKWLISKYIYPTPIHTIFFSPYKRLHFAWIVDLNNHAVPCYTWSIETDTKEETNIFFHLISIKANMKDSKFSHWLELLITSFPIQCGQHKKQALRAFRATNWNDVGNQAIFNFGSSSRTSRFKWMHDNIPVRIR